MPKTVVAAASFDDMIAITGYTIFINIAVQGPSNPGWTIARGPLSVVFGIGLGCIAALFCSITKLWNNQYKRTFVLVASGADMPCRVYLADAPSTWILEGYPCKACKRWQMGGGRASVFRRAGTPLGGYNKFRVMISGMR